ncbi:MAG: hypothetical protein ABMA64_11745 [Myxococcota bacterium]
MLPLLGSTAVASPLNPWGSAIARDSAVFVPYLYVYPDGVSQTVYGGVGLTDRADVTFGAGAFVPFDGEAQSSLELFPRYFVTPAVGLSPHLYWTPGTDRVTLAPELHLNHARGWFAGVVNLGWRPTFGADGPTAGTVALIVAPELRITDRTSVFVEVDPTFSLEGDAAAMLVVPGFGTTLDPSGRHTVSIGLQVPVLPQGGPASVGAAYTLVIPPPSEG